MVHGPRIERPTDEQIVEAIGRYIARMGYPPSVREIGGMAYYNSSAEGKRVVDRLVERGLIERTPGIPRGIRIKSSVMKADTEEF